MLPPIDTPEIAAPEPTPLARTLGVSAADCLGVQGSLTPASFDAPERETEALFRGAAVHDLGWLRMVAVRGEDRLRWLSGMVTNMVEDLPSGSGAYNLILNAQGRIQGDADVWRTSGNLLLGFTATQAPYLLAHLDHFIIMDDVELLPLEGLSALGVTGPLAEKVLAAIGLKAPAPAPEYSMACVETVFGDVPIRLHRGYGPLVSHFIIWAPGDAIGALWQRLVGAGATPVGATALETLRIAEGIPLFGRDIESRDLPQETSQVRALHYSKGCYLGQEIVERIRSRGQVHRHLRQLELTLDSGAILPAPGTELRKAGAAEDAKPAATLTSIATLPDGRILALANVRAEAEVGNPLLVFPGGSARVLAAPPAIS